MFVEERLDWSLAQMRGTGADCARPTLTLAKNHKQDDGAGYSKRVKRGDGHQVGVRNPRAVRSTAGRNTVQPGGHAGRRDVTPTVNLRDKPTGCLSIAATRGIADRFADGYLEAPRHRASADDATTKTGETN